MTFSKIIKQRRSEQWGSGQHQQMSGAKRGNSSAMICFEIREIYQQFAMRIAQKKGMSYHGRVIITQMRRGLKRRQM